METQGFVPAEASYQPSVKRRRVITSCTECYRRKQKCDREHPCNNCVARDVTDKCLYVDSPRESLKDLTGSEISDEFTAPPGPADENASPSQLGYSITAGSNAFTELEKFLNDEREFDAIQSTHNRPLFHTQLGAEALLIISRLPPKTVIDELIAVFFSDVNWHYFIIEKVYFNDLFSRWYSANPTPVAYLTSDKLSHELRYFPGILFQVVALSLQFLPPGSDILKKISINDSNPAQRYSELGMNLMELLGRRGSALTAVQTSLLRASFLKNLGRGTDAWMVLGEAIRQSQELGFHRQPRAHNSSPPMVEQALSLFWYNEYKKRVWINLYAWDSLMAMILGRPKLISDDDCDAQAPIDCNIPKDPSTTVPMTVEDDKRPTTVSASLIRYSIAMKVHEVHALKLDKPYPKDYPKIKVLHDQTLAMLDQATPVLRPENPNTSWDTEYPYLPQQREEICSLAYSFIASLHRPHMSTHIESREAALKAAIAVLDSQQRLFDQTSTHHYMLFLLSFYTVDAAILLSAITAQHPPESYERKLSIDRALQQCIDRLSLMAHCNPTAQSGLDIIQRCHRKLKQCGQLSSPAVGVQAHQPITDAPLREVRRELDPGNISYPQYTPFEPQPFIDSMSSEDFSDVSNAAQSFDQEYWLQLMDNCSSAPLSQDLTQDLPSI